MVEKIKQKPQNRGEIVDRDEGGRFIKGRRKTGGKQPGNRHFNTVFDEALREIVKNKELKIDNPEKKMMVKALIEALKGNYHFWKALAEWRYGKPKESINLNANTLDINQLLNNLNEGKFPNP